MATRRSKVTRKPATKKDKVEELLSKSAFEVQYLCDKPNYSKYCDEEFWRQKIERDFEGIEIEKEATWKETWEKIFKNDAFYQAVVEMIEYTRSDVYAEKQRIKGKYEVYLREYQRIPWACSGKQRYASSTEKQNYEAPLETRWILTYGDDGEKERRRLAKKESDNSFRNYIKATASVVEIENESEDAYNIKRKDSSYFGAIFIPLFLGEDRYYYDTPSLFDNNKSKVEFSYYDDYFGPTPDIDEYLKEQMEARVSYIRIYFFISPFDTPNNENFSVVIVTGEEKGFKNVPISNIEETLFRLIETEGIENSCYPIVTRTKSNRARKLEYGPWITLD
jgi:hypothetical protein